MGRSLVERGNVPRWGRGRDSGYGSGCRLMALHWRIMQQQEAKAVTEGHGVNHVDLIG